MELLTAFLQGALAGYGIAIPVGAVAVLIIDQGLRRGFPHGFAAGGGAAAADLLYALLAAIAGSVLAPLLVPFSFWLKLVGAAALLFMGFSGLWSVFSHSKATLSASSKAAPTANQSPWKTFARFLAITLLNPMTVIYFAALILGGSANLTTESQRLVFVMGAGLASLSWQSLLAGIGAFGHRMLSPRFQVWTSLFGNLIVLGFAIRLLLSAFA